MYVATAVLAAAPVSQAAAEATTPQQEVRRPTQADLYAAFPTRPDSGIADGFYLAYGSSFASIELDQGTRLANLALITPTTPQTQARAGVGSSGSPWTVALIALALTALALIAALAMPSAARAAVPDGFVGITTEDAYTGKDDYAQKQLKAQRAAGFTVARQVFRWNEIEWGSGAYDFSATDRFVRNASIAGMRVMPLIQGEPEWATSRPKGNTYRGFFPPKDNATIARFGAVLAQRYGPGGQFWAQNPTLTPFPFRFYQVWNEPNFPLYWGGKPNGAAYARMVIAVSGAIRSVQPDAYIVSAGIPDSTLGQRPKKFVKAMLKAKAGPALNAIGIHPYAIDVKSVMKITRGLRSTINTAGGRKLDLWVTEIGWAAGGPKTKKRTVSYARQGPIVRSAFQSLAKERKRLKLRGVVYYAWRDSTVYKGGKDFWGLHTGLLNRQGKAKPGMKVVTKALRKLK
jgi:GH35 family endo-1,4-beta-xylanase